MLTYEYVCDACGFEFEREQRISEAPVKKCPKCSKLRVRRMITQGNFILKGSGWYADGYGSSQSAAPPKDNSEAPTTKDAKGDDAPAGASSESKPAPAKKPKKAPK